MRKTTVFVSVITVAVACVGILSPSPPAQAAPQSPPAAPEPPEQAPPAPQGSAADAPIAWCELEPDMECLGEGCADDKVTMIYFYMVGCEFCAKLESEVFADGGVKKRVAKYVTIKVDVSKHLGLAREFGVIGAPTTILMRPGCETGSRLAGVPTVAEFMKELDEIEQPAPPPDPPDGKKPGKPKGKQPGGKKPPPESGK